MKYITGDNNITNPDINKSGIYNVSASSEYGGQPYYSAFGAFSNVKRYWAGQITNPYNSSGVYTGPIATSYINEFGSGVSVYGEYVQIKLPQKFKITNFTTATCFSPPRELLIIGSIDGLTWKAVMAGTIPTTLYPMNPPDVTYNGITNAGSDPTTFSSVSITPLSNIGYNYYRFIIMKIAPEYNRTQTAMAYVNINGYVIP